MSTGSVPQLCPTARELDDLELLVGGGFGAISSFNEPGSPVTLTLPPGVAADATLAGAVEVVDPEGLPLARVAWPGGAVEPLTHAQFGPFRHLYLTAAQLRRRHHGRTVVPVVDALTVTQLDALRGLGPVLLLVLVGTGTPALPPVALLRASLLAAAELPDAAVVAVPLASRGEGSAETDAALRAQVVAAYAGTAAVHELPPVAATDRPDHPPAIAAVVAEARPGPADQGLVVFFTGLSGSGKSTLARALTDLVLEQGVRTITSLDGDVVRRNLSAGLTFSPEDRETNIRRIGWVAAEISRHGGMAVVSPIAPYDRTRRQVRDLVAEAGGAFFLVHVATPLEECERRDRKGMYAKARRGEIPEFTGISAPYEEPTDADVRVDTTGRTIDDALHEVLVELRARGHLDLLPDPESAPPPLQVLFVCTANICRSPAMELIARDLLPDSADVEFSSAGTRGFVDHPVDEEIGAWLTREGVDTVGFRSRTLTPELLAGADLVITAETAHRRLILEDHPAMFRKVLSLGQLHDVVGRMGPGQSREELVRHLAGSRRSEDPSHDVADPYRRGPQAARAAGEQIRSMLEVVVPALSAGGG